MPQSLIKTFDKIYFTIITLLVFLLPLFFLPLTNDFFEFQKQALLVLLTSIAVIIWLTRIILTKTVRLTLTPVLLPLVLLTAATFVSLIVVSPNRTQALLGRPLYLACLTLLYLSLTTRLTQAAQVARLTTALIASSALLGLIYFLNFTSIISRFLPQAPAWFKSTTFTPAGSPLALLIFLIPMLVISLNLTLKKAHPAANRLFSFTASLLIAVGIFASAITIFKVPGNFTLLPLSTAWEIAVENFKDPRAALLGTGPESFLDSFTKNKSAGFNLSSLWSLRFTTSRNEPLLLLTTIGLAGLLTYLFLLVKTLTTAKTVLLSQKPLEKTISLGLVAAVILQFLFPVNLISLTLFILLIAFQQTLRKLEVDPAVKDVFLHLFAVTLVTPDHADPTPQKAEVLPLIISTPLILAIVIGIFFGATRIYASELLFKSSLDAATANKGTETYNLQIKALQKNPRSEQFRTTYALTNLALANALASRKNLTQQDRANITQLIQQSIREAKVATTLNPQRTANWETLATIYRSLINVAQGSKDWAIAAYVQAIQTDPQNPALRLDLGGIYYGIKDYDLAIRFFEQASVLKPNWPNAYYNLSAAYKAKGDIEKAIDAMKSVLQNLDPSATDYSKAQAELQALNDQLAQPAASPTANDQRSTTSDQIAPPSPLPSPKPPAEQVKLPPEAAFPEATSSATPTPLPTVGPTPNPS